MTAARDVGLPPRPRVGKQLLPFSAPGCADPAAHQLGLLAGSPVGSPPAARLVRPRGPERDPVEQEKELQGSLFLSRAAPRLLKRVAHPLREGGELALRSSGHFAQSRGVEEELLREVDEVEEGKLVGAYLRLPLPRCSNPAIAASFSSRRPSSSSSALQQRQRSSFAIQLSDTPGRFCAP